MPRPRKCRRVAGPPGHNRFGPLGETSHKHPIILSVDEYETIRLIDHEKHTQAEAGEMMEIGRSTVQATYDKAREKIAGALVEGRMIRIEGGDVRFDKTSCEKGGRGRMKGGMRHNG